MIDEAVKSVDVESPLGNPRNQVLLRLAERPARAIRTGSSHCERIADDIMRRGWPSYGDAADWLQKAAQAYDAAGRRDDWIDKIDGLIEKYRRKYKLRPLLEALRP